MTMMDLRDTLMHSALQEVCGYTIAASFSIMMGQEAQLCKCIRGTILKLDELTD